jgi:hypothetical protein
MRKIIPWRHQIHRRNPECRGLFVGKVRKGIPKIRVIPAQEPPRLIRSNGTPNISSSTPVRSIDVWIYHPDVMSKIGEYVLWEGEVWKITKLGLEPYCQA